MTSLIELKNRLDTLNTPSVKMLKSRFDAVVKVMELTETDNYFTIYDNIENVLLALKKNEYKKTYAIDCIKCFKRLLINTFSQEEKDTILFFKKWDKYNKLYFTSNYYDELETVIIEPEVVENEPEIKDIETPVIEIEPENIKLENIEPEIKTFTFEVEDEDEDTETESLDMEATSVLSEEPEPLETQLLAKTETLKLQQKKVIDTVDILKTINPEYTDIIELLKTKIYEYRTIVNELIKEVETLHYEMENVLLVKTSMSKLTHKDHFFINKNYENVNTKKSIISIVNTLIQKANDKKIKYVDLVNLLENKEFVLYYINSYPATSTQRNKTGMLYGLMKKYKMNQEYLNFWEAEMKKKSKVDKDKKGDTLNQHRENITTQNLTINDLYNALDYWEKKDKYGLYHLVLATYTYILPRRLDFRHAVFVDKLPTKIKKDENYIIIDNKGKVRLVFYNFKTVKKLEFWDRKLKNNEFSYLNSINKVHPRFDPEKLQRVITQSYLKNKRKYFIELDGDIYSQSGFSNLVSTAFKQAIKKHVVATDLRSIVISEIFNNPKINLASKYEEEMANDMGQKEIGTMRNYRIIQNEPEALNIPSNVSQNEKNLSIKSLQSVNKYVNEIVDKIEKTN